MFGSRRVAGVAGATVAFAFLVGPLAFSQPAVQAQPGTAQQFPISGPYPYQQQVSLAVPIALVVSPSYVRFVAEGVTGVGGGKAYGDPEFGVALDGRRCLARAVDQLNAYVTYNDPGAECPYENETPEINSWWWSPPGSADLNTVALAFPADAHLNVALPDASSASNPLIVSRYAGDAVRVSVGARSHLQNDPLQGQPGFFAGPEYHWLSMGSGKAQYGFRTNFGGGPDPSLAGTGSHYFETCSGTTNPANATDGGDDQIACFATEFQLTIAPVATRPDRNLQVTAVAADAERCQGGTPFTFGVSVANPESVTSQPYVVFISRLDSSTNQKTAGVGYSTILAGLASHTVDAGIAVPITLQGGDNHLAVWAYASGTDPGDMATVAETTVNCDQDPRSPRRPDIGGGASADAGGLATDGSAANAASSPTALPGGLATTGRPGGEGVRATATPTPGFSSGRPNEGSLATAVPTSVLNPSRQTDVLAASPTPAESIRGPIDIGLPTAIPTATPGRPRLFP